jgi:glycine/D-amino acid oxidase-like deaminating enzyme
LDRFDQIVVGGGLAGTVLVYQLTKAGQRVCWIKSGLERSSTMVAAGLINPLVFRYLTPVWKVQTLLPEAISFYKMFEKEFGQQCLHEIKIAKVFGDQDAVLWQRKMQLTEIAPWIDGIGAVLDNELLIQPHGVGFVNGYWLDTGVLLRGMDHYLSDKTVSFNERFDLKRLNIEQDKVSYDKRYLADKLIFCEGWEAAQNPLFDFIQFRPVKGELLTIKIDNLKSKYLLNKEVFLLPLGEQLFRLGSTYDWDDLSIDITTQAREYLLEKLASFLPTKVEVIDHQAGVRPAVADRRPVAGLHPEYPQLAIFNGLGARGVMIAPWLGQQLLELLLYQKPLDEEVDLQRFMKR